MSDDGVGETDAYILCREINTQLDTLSRAVMECKSLEHAATFCRFLRWSGLIKILKYHASTGALPCDGAMIEHKANELLREVEYRFKTGSVEPQIEITELQRINHKLDLIAGHIADMLQGTFTDLCDFAGRDRRAAGEIQAEKFITHQRD